MPDNETRDGNRYVIFLRYVHNSRAFYRFVCDKEKRSGMKRILQKER